MENNEIKFDNNGELDSANSGLTKELNYYKTKFKKAHRANIILSVFFGIFAVALIVFFVFLFLVLKNIKSNFRGLLGPNYNIASISQMSKENAINLENFTKKLAYIDDVINIMYYYDKDNKKVEDAMFAGYLKALDDKYSEYYPAKEFEEFTEKTTEGVYHGIGCLVTQDAKTKDCIVNLVYEDSPAEKGGVLKDDIFVSINGEYVRGLSVDEIVSKVRGEEGAKRVIEVFRPSLNQNVSLTVYCGKVDIKLVNTDIYENDIGYIDVDEFTGKASKQFKKGMDDLIDKGVKGIIIDLRGNPGGELMTVCEMMDYVIKDRDGRYTLNQKEEVFETGKTLLVYIKEKEEIVDAAYASDRHEIDVPIVILTNQGTASAAELFTECLRDYKKATVVGVRTYGKGVVQTIIPYEDGSAFKFTASEYFPPSGYSIDVKGILPDYSLDYSGDEILYNDDNNIVVYEDDTKYILDKDGGILEEQKIEKATGSEIVENDEKPHVENFKIYDDNNEFVNEDWYLELYDKYDDKQILQALIVLRNEK